MIGITIEALQDAMNNQIKALGGIDAAIDACERMYDTTFRSEPFCFSEVIGRSCETTMKLELARPLFCAEFKTNYPLKPSSHEHADEYGEVPECVLESYYYSCEAFDSECEDWFDGKYPDFKIDGNTMVVDFCNYKGEGEDGVGLYELHKHLPVFRSKSESFNQVN